jgi:hypothetical protein
MSTVEELIREVKSAGLVIRLDPPDLIVKPAARLRPDLETRLRTHKAELIEHLQGQYNETELSDSMRRLEASGICVAIFEDGRMRVLVSEADKVRAIDAGGTVYSPADMYHYVRLTEPERRMVHSFKKQFGGTTEWRQAR